MSQDELLAEYRRARAFCLPCRVLDNGDRDGIPNVLVEAMAAGAPVVTTPVSGIPELVARRRQRAARRARRPRRARRRRRAPARATATLARAVSGEARARRSRERFDGERARRHAADAVPRGDRVSAAPRDRRRARIAPRPVFCVIEHAHRDRDVADDACRGRFTLRRRDARPRRRARLARRGAARRRGVADRVGQVLLRPRPRPRLPRDRRRALPRRLGAARRVAGSRQVAGRTRRHRRRRRPPGPELDLRLGSVRRRARLRRACAPSSQRRLLDSIGDAGRATSATTSPPSATTARSSSTRCWSSRSRCPSSTRRRAARASRLAELHAQPADRHPAPTASTASSSTHYHLHRPALVRRRARERPPLRRSRSPAATTSGSRAPATSRMHCHRPDGTIPALVGQRQRRLRASCSSSPPTCSTARTCAGPRPRAPRARRRAAATRASRDGGYYVQRSGWGDRGRAVRRRALPDLRLRPARRRRPRPLRPAQRRVAAGGRPLVVDPGRYTYAEQAPEPAPLVQGHRRAQHRRASTASTRRRTGAASRARARSPAGACSAATARRPRHRSRGEAHEPRLRRRAPRARSRSSAASTG